MILRRGNSGTDVLQLQRWLIALGYKIKPDGFFGGAKSDETGDALESFQREHGLKPDRIFGPVTKAKMMVVLADVSDVSGGGVAPDTPGILSTAPKFPSMTASQRVKIFGRFDYTVTGKTDNSIIILGGWESKNISKFYIPQLDGMPFYHPGSNLKCNGFVRLHNKAGAIFQEFFDRVDDAGLMNRIKTFEGGFVARLVRGSKTSLSNHAWGTAIDINGYANGLGREPARIGQDGCVRELVPIAHECGLYWGGNFSRKDGMHFEVAALQ